MTDPKHVRPGRTTMALAPLSVERVEAIVASLVASVAEAKRSGDTDMVIVVIQDLEGITFESFSVVSGKGVAK